MLRLRAPLLIAGLGLADVMAPPARAQTAAPAPASAQQSDAALAENLENPIYHQMTIPLQNNYDCCFVPGGGIKYTLNVQPVSPLGMIGNVEAISRTVFPVIYEFNNTPGQGGHWGIGDSTQAFYFGHESRTTFYYAGPIFLIPSEDPQISGGQWAAGPTFAVGGRSGPFSASFLYWTYWSFAGLKGAGPVSSTRLQPQLGYTFPDSTTLRMGVEADYNWVKFKWNAPFHAGVARIFRLAACQVQLALEARAFTSTQKGPWDGVRFTATWVLPK
jgi:hypothetical protein